MKIPPEDTNPRDTPVVLYVQDEWRRGREELNKTKGAMYPGSGRAWRMLSSLIDIHRCVRPAQNQFKGRLPSFVLDHHSYVPIQFGSSEPPSLPRVYNLSI